MTAKPNPAGRILRFDLRVKAAPRQVWEAWAEPAKIAQWFSDDARGDVRAGGTLTLIFRRFGMEIPYTVVEADPGRKLVLFGSLGGRSGTLEITIRAEGNETVLELMNSGFREGADWDEEYEGVRSGWTIALQILRRYVERSFGRPRLDLLEMRPAAYEYRDLLPFFATPEGLERWLARRARIGAVGEPWSVEMHDGTRLGGRVVAKTDWEVGLDCDEIDGIVELKGFSMGPGRRVVAIRASAWRTDRARLDALAASFREALAGLAPALEAASRARA